VIFYDVASFGDPILGWATPQDLDITLDPAKKENAVGVVNEVVFTGARGVVPDIAQDIVAVAPSKSQIHLKDLVVAGAIVCTGPRGQLDGLPPPTEVGITVSREGRPPQVLIEDK